MKIKEPQRETSETIDGVDTSVFSAKPHFFSEAGFNLKSCTSKTKTKSNFEKPMWREGETLTSFSFKRFVVCKTKRLVVRKGRVSKEINHSHDHLEGEYV